MNTFRLGRVAILIASLAIGFILALFVTPHSDLISIADFVVFFLGSYVFMLAWPAASKIFTEHPIKFSRLLSLGITLIAAGIILAAVGSVKWRAFGGTSADADTLLRFSFRWCWLLGFGCIIAAPELFEQPLTAKRVGQLGAMLVCVVLTACLLLYGTRLRSPHDNKMNMTVESATPP